jgi:hypothetical protein
MNPEEVAQTKLNLGWILQELSRLTVEAEYFGKEAVFP